MLSVFLRGLLIGFSIAAPVGPSGCSASGARSPTAEWWASSPDWARPADAFYGAVAGFGLTVVSGALVHGQAPRRLVGGAFLCHLGVRTFLARPAQTAAVAGRRGLLGAYASTLALTLTNPSTILSFVAIFAGLGLGSGGSNYASAGLLVAGVFIGSALWWLILSGTAGVLRGRLTPLGLRWMNRLSAVILAGFGVAALVSVWPGG